MGRTVPPFETHRDGLGTSTPEPITKMILLTAVVLGVVSGARNWPPDRRVVARRSSSPTAGRTSTTTPVRAGAGGVSVA